MGFRLNRTYVLEFEGDMEGAEVTLRATSIGTVMKIGSSRDKGELIALLADHVLSWNLEDEKGEPLPITAEAITGELEEVVVAALLREWYRAAVGATAPLDASATPEAREIEATLA